MRALSVVALMWLLVGCQVGQPPAAPTASSTPVASATETPSPSPDEGGLANAIRLRQDWGLRSDAEWVRSVAEDPDSVMSELGILVTPEEEAELGRRFAEEPRTELIAYGALHADQFGGLYIDNNAGGVVVMLFTAGLERHQQAVAALAPAGVRVQVRACRFTEDELTALMDELVADAELRGQLQLITLVLDTINNVVVLEAKSNDTGLKLQLEARFAGRLVANIHPLPGPWQNRPDGEGWRLLSAGTVRGSPHAYTVRVASTDAEWLALWTELATGTELPEVDFNSEIVAAFGEGIGGSCPELRLDDVVISTALGLAYSVTSDPLAPRGCTDDLAGAALFVVALARSALPDSPFTVRLRQELICGSCHEEELTVDLR